MSNQRPGKYEKKLDVGPNMTPMAFIKCITQCAKVLDANGHEDPAFYFEQLADYIKSGKQMPTEPKDIIHALGI